MDWWISSLPMKRSSVTLLQGLSMFKVVTDREAPNILTFSSILWDLSGWMRLQLGGEPDTSQYAISQICTHRADLPIYTKLSEKATSTHRGYSSCSLHRGSMSDKAWARAWALAREMGMGKWVPAFGGSAEIQTRYRASDATDWGNKCQCQHILCNGPTAMFLQPNLRHGKFDFGDIYWFANCFM